MGAIALELWVPVATTPIYSLANLNLVRGINR